MDILMDGLMHCLFDQKICQESPLGATMEKCKLDNFCLERYGVQFMGSRSNMKR